MNNKLFNCILSALAELSFSILSFAHPAELLDDPHEHLTPTLPASNANVRLIGKAKVNQTFDARVSDVAVMGDYAYLGVFDGGNNCQKGGVIVFNISNPAAAIGGVSLIDVTNPKNPKILFEGFGDIDPPGDAFQSARSLSHLSLLVFLVI